jgi:hypothetical protein
MSDPNVVPASRHPLQTPPPKRAMVPSSPPAFGRSSIDTTQYRLCTGINFAAPAAQAASAVTYVTDQGNQRTVNAYAVGARFAATRQVHGYSMMFAVAPRTSSADTPRGSPQVRRCQIRKSAHSSPSPGSGRFSRMPM